MKLLSYFQSVELVRIPEFVIVQQRVHESGQVNFLSQ